MIELEIPPRSDHLALVRLVVESSASVDGRLSERRIDDLRLAVSEACTNAVDAQAASSSNAPIQVRIDASEKRVVVTVIDHAGGFDLAALDPIPPVTDPLRLRHERGLGIPLIQSLVDDATFTRTSDGTEVRLEVQV